MKNIVAIFVIFLMLSCNKKSIYVLEKEQPIVDLPTNPEFFKSNLSLDAAAEKQDQQTAYVLNNKRIKKVQLINLLKKKNIKNFNVIKDSTQIEKLGFDFKDVKQVMLLNN